MSSAAVRKGKPIPDGAVITLVQWSVEQDANGVPLKGADGRFVKKEVVAHTVMEKRAGWGADYPADWPRNGEWEYAAFTADGVPNAKANANNKAGSAPRSPSTSLAKVLRLRAAPQHERCNRSQVEG